MSEAADLEAEDTEDGPSIEAIGLLREIAAEQAQLRQDFERLAAHVAPLLAKQTRDAENRTRMLETRLRTRQERPLIVRMANLLADVRRIESADDIKVHVEEAMLEALTSAGYQEMGAKGDHFDPRFHEPMSGSVGRAGIVSHVHRRGLSCYGDVLIKAKVDVEPAVEPETEQGEVER
jgi:molecular chaperone GrpE (heat shock protein)